MPTGSLNSNSSRDLSGKGFLPSIKSNRSRFNQEQSSKNGGGQNSYKVPKQLDPLSVFKQLRESEGGLQKENLNSKKNYGTNKVENGNNSSRNLNPG